MILTKVGGDEGAQEKAAATGKETKTIGKSLGLE
jgi:hypothetical protein